MSKNPLQETLEGSIDPVSLIRASVSSTFNRCGQRTSPAFEPQTIGQSFPSPFSVFFAEFRKWAAADASYHQATPICFMLRSDLRE
jgi:hypothetical protein